MQDDDDEDDDALKEQIYRRMIRHWSTFDRNLLQISQPPQKSQEKGRQLQLESLGSENQPRIFLNESVWW